MLIGDGWEEDSGASCPLLPHPFQLVAVLQGEGEKVVMLFYFNLNADVSAVAAHLIGLLDDR